MSWNGQHLLAAIHLVSEQLLAEVLGTTTLGIGARQSEVVEAANDRLRHSRLIEDGLFADTVKEVRSLFRRNGTDVKANVRRRIYA